MPPQSAPQVVIVSGPSGVGKGSVLRELMMHCPLTLELGISVTTRPPRAGERDGVDYHFVPQAEFDAKRDAGELLECCEVFGLGFWYGTLKSDVIASLDAGKWVILEIDVNGAKQVQESFPKAITLFVGVANDEELERRLRNRGTETEADLQRRLKTARAELQHADRYDHVVVNDRVGRAAREICEYLKSRCDSSGATHA